MVDDGVTAEMKHRGHRQTQWFRPGTPDQIDIAVVDVQAPVFDAVRDRPAAQACSQGRDATRAHAPATIRRG
jgi:hypothetical protein